MKRRELLVTGCIYHIYTKSIAGFKVFNSEKEYSRIITTIKYYQYSKSQSRFSDYLELKKHPLNKIISKESDNLVDIIAYCIMPTHLHFILKQIEETGISKHISQVLNSYTRYFNLRHNRKGPLWEGRFKSALVKTNEQLLHLTRYIHLNPVTGYLVNNPLDWPASSYKEYVLDMQNGICNFRELLDIAPTTYKEFVENRIVDQRALAKIKKLTLE